MRFINLFILALVVFVLLPVQQAGAAMSIDKVRFGVHDGKTRFVAELSKDTKFNAFVLRDPWRVVIDLPDFTWKNGDRSIASVPSETVKDIRRGFARPGVSRIVLDTVTPVKIAGAFMLPPKPDGTARLVVDFMDDTPSGASIADLIAGMEEPASVSDSKGFALPPRKPDLIASLITGTAHAAPMQARAIAAPQRMRLPPKRPSSSIATASTRKIVAKPIPIKRRAKVRKPIIVVDAGHGGMDPGAIAHSGIHEKKITLAMAKKLKNQLESGGRYKVILTRDRNKYLKLYQRRKLARKYKGDLFISLHADSVDRKKVRGLSVYTLSDGASDIQTAKLEAQENNADRITGVNLVSVGDQAVANILIDLTMRDTMNQSKALATSIVKSMRSRGIKTLENPIRSAGFAVLKSPDIPSVLVELGFLSNPKEAKMLARPDYQRKMAKGLAAAIDRYFAGSSVQKRL